MATVLVTGAGRGIGLEFVRQLAARGDAVVASAREPERAEPLQALAAESAGRIEVVRMDVAEPRSIAAARDELAGRPIDALINNAGVIGPERQSPLDMDFDGLEETFRVNTIAPLRVAHAFLPNLRAAQRAKIMTVSSVMGSLSSSSADRVAYRASKAGVNMLMKGLAAELGPEGIAVAIVHPGWVRTDMGGASASLDPADSVRGLIRVLDRLEPAQSGRFVDYRGEPVAW